MKRALLLLVLPAALLAGGWRWHLATRARAHVAAPVPTAEVTRGRLVVTLPVTGQLSSASETPVRTDLAGALAEICPDNSVIKPGDFAYRLDTKDLEDQREELRRAQTEAEENATTQKSDAQTRITQSESDVVTAQEELQLEKEKAAAQSEKLAAQVKFAEGELARTQQELARCQRLAKLHYLPGVKLEEAEKACRAKEFSLKQQRAQQADAEQTSAEQIRQKEVALQLSQHALTTAKADALSHAQESDIAVAEAGRKLAEVETKIAQSTVLAPAAGLAVIQTNDNSWPERRPYRLGDQVESGGAPVMIYDVGRMQVRCQIGELDVTSVKKGQQAFISTPADAEKRYPGTVTLVEELAKEANVWQGGTPGKKVFEVLVALQETDPSRLRPGMTVDLEIVLNQVREATLLPIRAVFTEQGKQFVFVARGQEFVRVPVALGTRNDLLVEVKGGVKAGDRVSLERPPQPPARTGGKR